MSRIPGPLLHADAFVQFYDGPVEPKTDKGHIVRKHQLQYLRPLRCADLTSFAMRVEPLGVRVSGHRLPHGTICLSQGIL